MEKKNKYYNDRYFVVEFDNKIEWLKNRGNYIGGSDSYPLGFEKMDGGVYLPEFEAYHTYKPAYSTLFTLWCEKNGYKIFKESSSMKYGKNREAIIRGMAPDLVKERIPGGVQSIKVQNTSDVTYFLKECPQVGANLDGILEINQPDGHGDTYTNWAGLEIKTSYDRKAWVNGVPKYYWAQVQHYMLVTGLTLFYIVVEFGGQKGAIEYEVYQVIYNEEYGRCLLYNIRKFWDDYAHFPPCPKDEYEAIEKPYVDYMDKYRAVGERGIDSSAGAYLALTNEIKRLEKEKKTIALTFKKIYKGETIEGNRFMIKKINYQRKVLNKERLMFEVVDADKYFDTVESDRLIVKEIEEGDDE